MTHSSEQKRVEGTLALSEVLAPYLPRNVNPHDIARRVRIAVEDRGFELVWTGKRRRRMFQRNGAQSHA